MRLTAGTGPIEEDFGDEVLDRLTIEWLRSKLEPEEWEILHLWVIEELTFSEIGKIIGYKYRGKELTGSAIRYHKDRIIKKLRELGPDAGVE